MSFHFFAHCSVPVALCTAASMLSTTQPYMTAAFGAISSIPFVGEYAACAMTSFFYVATFGGYFATNSMFSVLSAAFLAQYIFRASVGILFGSENNQKISNIAAALICSILIGYSATWCVYTAFSLNYDTLHIYGGGASSIISLVLSGGTRDNNDGLNNFTFSLRGHLHNAFWGPFQDIANLIGVRW